MSTQDRPGGVAQRRRFLGMAGSALAAAPLAQALAAGADGADRDGSGKTPAAQAQAGSTPFPEGERFHGPHQPGIASPAQRHTYFIAFDMVSTKRDDLVRLLRDWSAAAASLMAGPAAFDPKADPTRPDEQSGAAVDLPLARLTLTIGLGPSLFDQAGKDRFGIAARRPEALAELPRFAGDQLVPERSGGDLSIQACADDPQVVEVAVRRLARLARGVAVMRWAQTGFNGAFPAGMTVRNTMGFKDGTRNIDTGDPLQMQRHVWAGEEGPGWMRGGSYLVVRPIRIALEHWDDMNQAFQEQTVGRRKVDGAPLGLAHEHDTPDFERSDADGNPLVAENSHMAMSAAENNDGTRILRRAFSYDNGIARIAERWPPWRQLVTFDSGLLFMCYQRDPRLGFTRLFAHMAQLDMLNQFTTHVGSGLFACPPGARPGGFVGEDLFA